MGIHLNFRVSGMFVYSTMDVIDSIYWWEDFINNIKNSDFLSICGMIFFTWESQKDFYFNKKILIKI